MSSAPTYLACTESQVRALRSQLERLAQESDSAFVGFFNEHPELLQMEEFADLAKKAGEAYDRLQKAEQEAEERANRERRQKVARILERKNYHEAALAIETELDDADPQTLVWISKTLFDTIPRAGLFGWAKWCAYEHTNKAKRLAQTRAEENSKKLLAWFVGELETAEAILETAKAVPKGGHPAVLRQATSHIKKAEEIRFAGWALVAIERLIEKAFNNSPDSPEISCLLRQDSELAALVVAAPEKRRALVLLKAMKARVEAKVTALEKNITERRRRAAEKKSAKLKKSRGK